MSRIVIVILIYHRHKLDLVSGVLCLVVLTKYYRRLCVNNIPIRVLFYNANTVDSHECP
jgi:hypothetical protein